MTKIPKKAQQVFNQFIFDEMMNKMREVELLEKAHKRLIEFEGKAQASQNKSIHDLESAVYTLQNYKLESDSRLKKHWDRILELEKEVKDQREDYHAHISQLVTRMNQHMRY
jgi:hypothetical protein